MSEAEKNLREGMKAKSDLAAKFELLTHNTKVERVRGDLPLSLMPDAINNLGREIVDLDPDGPGIHAFECARRGLKDMYETLATIDDAHKSLLQPTRVGTVGNTGQPIVKMQVPPERAAEFNAAIDNRNARLTQISKRTADVLDQSIADLERHIATAVRHPRAEAAHVVAEHVEIRAYIKSLPQNERVNFILRACDSFDKDVVTAVLGVSAYASGITPKDKQLIQEQAHLTFAPREAKHAAALRKIKDHFIKATGTYVDEVKARRPEVPVTASATALARLKGAA